MHGMGGHKDSVNGFSMSFSTFVLFSEEGKFDRINLNDEGGSYAVSQGLQFCSFYYFTDFWELIKYKMK